MPLSMAGKGEPSVIKKVGGRRDTRQFLENLGFVAGGLVTDECPFTRQFLENLGYCSVGNRWKYDC